MTYVLTPFRAQGEKTFTPWEIPLLLFWVAGVWTGETAPGNAGTFPGCPKLPNHNGHSVYFIISNGVGWVQPDLWGNTVELQSSRSVCLIKIIHVRQAAGEVLTSTGLSCRDDG